jgi:hypothetical protein
MAPPQGRQFFRSDRRSRLRHATDKRFESCAQIAAAVERASAGPFPWTSVRDAGARRGLINKDREAPIF